MDDATEQKPVSGEQAADFAALSAGAAEPENAMQQAQQEQQGAQADQNAEGVAMVLDFIATGLPALGYPSVKDTLNAESRGVLAAVWTPVLTKYGVNLGDLGGQYKVEIMAVVATWPIASAIYQGIKDDAQARSEKAPKAQEPAKPPVVELAEPEHVTLG